MNEKAMDFTTGSIPIKLLKFMLPILGALVLQALYGAVDLMVVGRFGTDEGIAAVATGSNMINLITFTAAGLYTGVTVLIGRYLGEKQPKRISQVIGGAVFFFTILSVVLTIIILVFADVFVALMHVPESSFQLTTVYLRICGGGLFFIMAYNFISSIYRGIGNSRLPFIFVFIACIVNIIGDLVFVAVLNLNVTGAALATVIAQAVSVVLSLLISKRNPIFKINKKDICFNKETLKFLKIGIPLAFQEIITNTSFLAINAFINNLGYAEASGYGVAHKIMSFLLLVPASLIQSMTAFISQNVGAGNEKRAKQAMLTGMIIGSTVGIFVSTFIVLRGDIPSLVFTRNPQFVRSSALYLKGYSIEPIITCILFSFMGYYNGHGKSTFVMLQGVIQSLLIRIPGSYLMCTQPNPSLTKVGLAVPASTIFGITLCIIYYIKVRKEFTIVDIVSIDKEYMAS